MKFHKENNTVSIMVFCRMTVYLNLLKFEIYAFVLRLVLFFEIEITYMYIYIYLSLIFLFISFSLSIYLFTTFIFNSFNFYVIV